METKLNKTSQIYGYASDDSSRQQLVEADKEYN